MTNHYTLGVLAERRHCPHCKTKTRWVDYECSRCGEFALDLYRQDHAEPSKVARLTIDAIIAEYKAVGRPVPPKLGRYR